MKEEEEKEEEKESGVRWVSRSGGRMKKKTAPPCCHLTRLCVMSSEVAHTHTCT